jgi:hypothetical protein
MTVISSTARTVGSRHASRKPAPRLATTEVTSRPLGPPMRPGKPTKTSRPTA